MAVEAVGIGVAPSQAIRHLRRKADVTTGRWYDMVGEAHGSAFTVAGATRLDLLEDLRGSVTRALEEGVSLERFRREFRQTVAEHGWAFHGTPRWRSDVMLNTNLRTAYAAGRWQQLQELRELRPFWEYRHSHESANPRAQHQAWDGMVLPADDPFWKSGYPPNGWGCNCQVAALSQRDMDRLGVKVSESPKLKTRPVRVGGVVHQVPEGFDYGWDYNVGEADAAARSALVYCDRMAKVDPVLGSSAWAHDRARVAPAVGRGYRPWLDGLAQEDRVPRGEVRTLGAVSRRVVEAARAAGLELRSAGVGIQDHDAARWVGAARGGRELPLEVLQALPSHLLDPEAVLLDTAARQLVYVLRGSGDQAGRVQVLRVSPGADVAGDVRRPSEVVRGAWVAADSLRGSRFRLLDGGLPRD